MAEASLAALRAPSILNSQPWRWRPRGHEMELRLDQDRRLGGLDPTGRLQVLSCGVALDHALAALLAAGFAGDVSRLPVDSAPDVVARLRCGPVVPADRSRYDAIFRRRTERRPFADLPPTAEDLDSLRAAAKRHGVTLEILSDDQVTVFASVVATAATAERDVKPYQQDLETWSTRVRSAGDGVSAGGMSTTGAHRIPPRDLTPGRSPELAAGSGTDRGTVYAVLVTDDDHRADWLAAGEALSDLWLTLTARGLVASPISDVIEVPQASAALRRLLGWTGHPQIALRIGRPAEPDAPPQSNRRAAIDVVGLPGDA